MINPRAARAFSVWVVVALSAAFLAVGLIGLDTVPRVFEDEPWITAPGVGFWRTGRFATDLFTGYFGAERHFLHLLPLHPLLAGLFVTVSGDGLFAARLVSLLFATAMVLLTFLAGRRLLTPGAGVLASLVLASWPIAAPTARLTSGIPVADLGRVVRYDVEVPVFGVAALLMLLPVLVERREGSATRSAVAGALIGLGTLAHPYGAAWLVAMVAALVWRRRRAAFEPAALLVAGFAVILLPWIAYVAAHWSDAVGQNLSRAPRLRLAGPSFVWSNLAGEWQRWRAIGAAALAGGAATWIWLFGLAAGVRALARGWRAGDARAGLLLLLALVLAAQVVLLMQPRFFYYAASLWPIAAWIVAAGAADVWRRSPTQWPRAIVAGLVVVATVQGVWAFAGIASRARTTTSYPALCRRLAEAIPASARLMAMPNYWLGLRSHVAAYQAINVPVWRTNAAYTPQPVDFDTAMAVETADTLLVDAPLRELLGRADHPEDPMPSLARQMRDYVARRGRLILTIEDASYGRFEVYQLAPATSARLAAPSSRQGPTSSRRRAPSSSGPSPP